MELTAEKVEEIFVDCLFKDHEIIEGKPVVEPVVANGISQNFGFHPERLDKHKNEIIELLQELPTTFFQSGGGGWSFLNACNDKNGHQWGEHRNIEQLFCLGIGLNLVEYLFLRPMWPALPGGMPYVVIKL